MTEGISRRIDGERQGRDSDRNGPVFDPATGRERARVALASLEEVDRAVSVSPGEMRLDGSIVAEARAIIHAIGDSLAFHPLFGPPFCPL